MKKLFKRFAPLFLALVMVLGSCLTVSAAAPSSADEYKSVISKYQKDGFNYCLVIEQDSKVNYIRYIFTDCPLYAFYSSRDSRYYLGCKTSYNSYFVDYSIVSDSFSIGSTQSFSSGLYVLAIGTGSTLLYSNTDIYYSDAKDGDDPFFWGPERPLVAAVRGASPEETLKEVILLIPLSILFLAGCLGLRKALRLLLTLLRRA